MKKTSLFLLIILLFNIGFVSCKSDSEKMIEKCNRHLAALDSIQSKTDFDAFLKTHPKCLVDFLAAIRTDSIYADQDLTKALPYLFKAVYETFDKQEKVLLLDSPNEPATKSTILIAMYMLKLPYCTEGSKLQNMTLNLNSTILPITAKFMPNSLEMEIMKQGNNWLQMAIIRKTEIEEGNLYASQFLK